MNQEINRVLGNIENNIRHCDILKGLLWERANGEAIDYQQYYKKGYKNEEIRLGAELIDLYIMLKRYVQQNNTESKN